MRRMLITAGLTVAVVACASPRLDGQQAAKATNTTHTPYVSPWKTPWDYAGPRGAEHWSQLDPAYALCNEGKAQSPIDIRGAQPADLPALRFESTNAPLEYVTNNGHTIRVNYPHGSDDFLAAGSQRYQLVQFHFHRPSEELIGGKAYPMEAHLMYRSADGKVAGVTVFIEPGNANSLVEKVWRHMPSREGEQQVTGVQIDPAELLPQDTHSYFMYSGSVTAPPCAEGVTWFVLRTPIQLSAAQIAAYTTLFPHDARPVQPLNGRIVKESR